MHIAVDVRIQASDVEAFIKKKTRKLSLTIEYI
jgi:hypothetical protein